VVNYLRGICLNEFHRDVADISWNRSACNPFLSRFEPSSRPERSRPCCNSGFQHLFFVGGPISDVFRKSSILMLGCLFME